MREPIQLALTASSTNDLSLEQLSVWLAFKGVANFGSSAPLEVGALNERLQNKDAPNMIVAITDERDAIELNKAAKGFAENKNTMILWIDDAAKPEEGALPVVSFNQIERAAVLEDWADLCLLADQTDVAPHKSFWQKLAFWN